MALPLPANALDSIAHLRALKVPGCAHPYEAMVEFWYTSFAALYGHKVAYDIGANVGRHSIPLSKSYREVICFEPQPPPVIEKLRTNTQHCQNITIRTEALGNQTGHSSFVVNLAAPEESGLLERIYQQPAAKKLKNIDVEVTTLDAFHSTTDKPIGFIKIDVEGGEVGVLQGAMRTLRKHRPILSVEYGDLAYLPYGLTSESLFQVAQEAGYTVYNIFGFSLAEHSLYNKLLARYSWDYLLIPQEDNAALKLVETTRPILWGKFTFPLIDLQVAQNRKKVYRESGLFQ